MSIIDCLNVSHIDFLILITNFILTIINVLALHIITIYIIVHIINLKSCISSNRKKFYTQLRRDDIQRKG